ncbi:MAG TPA: histidine--tRNA ligase [Polyangiaceae bacterium]|nr:histidine--tRNA ligase [Polyangiaceae bacterium]
MQFRAVKGTFDVLPDEIGRWQKLEHAFRRMAELYGYQEARTPILEPLELFVRSVGETTEMVEKQMFALQRGDETLALRPEGTAGAARAYVANSVHAREAVSRWYYIGPMFRAEQPQRGRYRQFHQAGCEIYGDAGPGSDAEMIDMLVGFLQGLGIGGVRVLVNSLGAAGTRERYRQALKTHLSPMADRLSDHAKKRLEDNPLRILDSKDPRDQEAIQEAPSVLDLLDDDDRQHWERLCQALDALGTPYEVAPRLVRGLDYYTRTLFELQATGGELGTQNALLGGGRYDGMIKDVGGPQTPAIGFAMGLERVLLAMPEDAPPRPPICFVAPIGVRAQAEALRLGRELRQLGIVTEVDTRGNSPKSMLRRADTLGAHACLLLGDAELDKAVVQLKDLRGHTQQEVPRAEVAARVAALLGTDGEKR